MNIILIGFMGSGKSTVGQSISKKLSYNFKEMDAIILQKSGFADMSELFSAKGEAYLRASEVALSQELRSLSNTVISTGGGVVLNKIIIDNFKTNGVVFYLNAPFEILTERIAKDPTPRPLFNNITEARILFKKRLPLYKNLTDHTIDIQGKSVEEIAEEITQIYQSL